MRVRVIRVLARFIPPTDHRRFLVWAFVLYAAGGATILLFLASSFNPKMSYRLEEACETIGIKKDAPITKEKYEILPFDLVATCKNFSKSEYPSRNWIYPAVGLAVLLMLAYYPRALEGVSRFVFEIKEKDAPAVRGLSVVTIFVSVGAWIVFWHFKEPGLWLWWWLYGGLFGTVENVTASKIDFSFMTTDQYSEGVKLAILKDEHDRWTWGFGLFAALFVSVGISAALAFVFTANALVRDTLLFLYLSIFAYALVAVIAVYGDVIYKVNGVGGKIRELTRRESMG